jgi:hypothetical protein
VFEALDLQSSILALSWISLNPRHHVIARHMSRCGLRRFHRDFLQSASQIRTWEACGKQTKVLPITQPLIAREEHPADRGRKSRLTRCPAVEHALADPASIRLPDGVVSVAPAGQTVQCQYERFFPARGAGPLRTPTLITTGCHVPFGLPSIEQLDQELLTCPTPFDSLADLLTELVVPMDAASILTKEPIAEILLVPPASLKFSPDPKEDQCTFGAGKLSLLISAHPEFNTDQLRIGFKQFPTNRPVSRTSASAQDLQWQKGGSFKTARYEQDLSNVPLCLTILSHGDDFLGKWWLRDVDLSYNERFEIHRALDPTATFKTTFFNDKNAFEDRVSLLLLLLGLVPFKYGGIRQLTDAPDILAWSAQRHLYVIDCTTGDINSKGKLQRLYERTKKIRESLSRSAQPPIAVLPAIFTSLTTQETAVHSATAAAFQIAIVVRDNIINLLSQVEAPPTPEQLYNAALACIPTPQPSA